MKLNLKYYDKNDKYSDGDIEDTIIEFIKKYPDNYEEAFKEDSSWPVVYHLSDARKNVIRWYPFKESSNILEIGGGMGAITEELCHLCKSVTTVELSKRRATAILERNKNANNLEIIVGNFKNIMLTEKYDYILLNGVLEYSALYIDSNNPYEDFINKLKKNLKINGKILIAIENKMGLKYWCGALEDHTNKMFDGLNNYPESKIIRTFSKYELENIAKNVDMKANFYYMFPDYKFPKFVMTDKSLEKNLFARYSPYYCSQMNIILDEINLYKEIYNNKSIPFFANSYFIELSSEETKQEVEFAVFNTDYRKSEYSLCTYLKNNKFYKKALSSKSLNHLKGIADIGKTCKDIGLKIVDVKKDGDEIFTNKLDGVCLADKIKKLYLEEKYDDIEKIFDSIYKLIKKSAGKKVSVEKNVFDKYGIKEYPEGLEFYEHGFIDIVPNNIIEKDKELYLFDQEWYEENVPLEYIMYRGIFQTFVEIDYSSSLKDKLFKKYNIDEQAFNKLENMFMLNLQSSFFSVFAKYSLNWVYQRDIDFLVGQSRENVELRKQIDTMNCMIRELQTEKSKVDNELLSIVNSKRWKIINKIGNMLHR